MRKRSQMPKPSEEPVDIDLAPMLALMVTLIPILLLSSAFVHVMVIETSLPQVVAKAIENPQDPETQIQVHFKKQNRVDIQVLAPKSAVQTYKVPSQEGKVDVEQLNQTLSEIKSQNPMVFRAEIFPSPSTSYQDIVLAMDHMRESRSQRYTVSDPETGETVETAVLFPDVVFANVMGGF